MRLTVKRHFENHMDVGNPDIINEVETIINLEEEDNLCEDIDAARDLKITHSFENLVRSLTEERSTKKDVLQCRNNRNSRKKPLSSSVGVHLGKYPSEAGEHIKPEEVMSDVFKDTTRENKL